MPSNNLKQSTRTEKERMKTIDLDARISSPAGSVVSLVRAASIACCCLLLLGPCSAYSPDVNLRSVAGLWKLTQMPAVSSISHHLKEFTVYPKVPKRDRTSDGGSSSKKEVLLMLKEDGSFQQYSNDEQIIPDKLRFFDNDKTKENADKDNDVLDRYCEFGKLNGKWSLIGGRLILAADRPMDDHGQSSSLLKRSNDITDTILEGEVVATTEEGLLDNPVLSSDHKDNAQAHTTSGNDSPTASSSEESKSGATDCSETNTKSSRSGGSIGSVLDTHLSVPKGKVNIGRFTYPTHHPSFFDAPMFNPRAGGKFELKQVLGTLNTQQKNDEELEEKFSPLDFYNKTFLLTSRPIPEHQPKGNRRWSIKYNKFVEDPVPKSKKKEDDESMLDQPVHNIRVLELKFFANNTFATTGGMGDSAILRGRFSVIGEHRDHIWMQVMRFGFGRSVSGSVFSEGRSLTQDDEKTYWGGIEYANHQDDGEADEPSGGMDSHTTPMTPEEKLDDSGTKNGDEAPKLIVKGSVLFGYGLEPMPIGLFVLTETASAEEYDFDDDDDDDDEDDDDDNNDFDNYQFFQDSDNAFQ